MPEITEMHSENENDSFGRKIGLLAAILAILLSVFTISAHRSHTETIVLQNESNDAWSYYQAKRIRDYQLEMNLDLIKLLAPANPQTAALISAYTAKHVGYGKDLVTIKSEADEAVAKSALLQKKALYFDFAEGILEISLIMSSLYFISHKKLFPMFGLIFGIIGAIIGIIGFTL